MICFSLIPRDVKEDNALQIRQIQFLPISLGKSHTTKVSAKDLADAPAVSQELKVKTHVDVDVVLQVRGLVFGNHLLETELKVDTFVMEAGRGGEGRGGEGRGGEGGREGSRVKEEESLYMYVT